MQAQGLFDCHKLASLPYDEICARLVRAGYTKPPYVRRLIAERLQFLGRHLSSENLAAILLFVDARDVQRLDQELLSVKGIGPVVLSRFKQLQGLA
jgi:hypothetical protein